MMANWHYGKDRILRGALFGSGQVTPYHMRAWQAVENVEIVAVANRTVEKAHQLAKTFGIGPKHVYASHQDLLENEDVDFVDIATAPSVHDAQVTDAIDHGKHILCQKPFSTDMASAVRMTQKAEAAGVLLSINENWRWRSWYRDIKALLERNAIGQPRYLYIHRHDNATLPALDGSPPALAIKQPYTQKMAHLILYEWGIHMLDVTRFLFGNPDSLYANALKVSRLFKGEDRIVLVLSYADRHALVDLSWSTVSNDEKVSPFEKIEIEGDEGIIRLDPSMDTNLHISTREASQSMPSARFSDAEEYQLSYTRTHKNFIENLRAGGLPESHARENIQTLGLVFAAYQSAEDNDVICFETYQKEHGA
jgi:D-apiose dehydrogenase